MPLVRITLYQALKIMKLERDMLAVESGKYKELDSALIAGLVANIVRLRMAIQSDLNVPSWSHAVDRAQGYIDRLADEQCTTPHICRPSFVAFSTQN